MKYDLNTVEGRVNYLIDERTNKIEELERILKGEDLRYKKHMQDQVFINSVTKDLNLEKQLLNELINDYK